MTEQTTSLDLRPTLEALTECSACHQQGMATYRLRSTQPIVAGGIRFYVYEGECKCGCHQIVNLLADPKDMDRLSWTGG